MENGQGIIASNSFGHKPLLSPIKVFTCKYCGRKFLNSRALGGHQNAHKKERTIWMAGVSNQTSSIGVEPHSLLRKPVQDEMSTRKDVQSFKRVGDPIWKKQTFKGAASQDLGWPGSFHVCSSDSNGPDTEAIVASTSSVGGRINEASYELNMHGGLDLELRL